MTRRAPSSSTRPRDSCARAPRTSLSSRAGRRCSTRPPWRSPSARAGFIRRRRRRRGVPRLGAPRRLRLRRRALRLARRRRGGERRLGARAGGRRRRPRHDELPLARGHAAAARRRSPARVRRLSVRRRGAARARPVPEPGLPLQRARLSAPPGRRRLARLPGRGRPAAARRGGGAQARAHRPPRPGLRLRRDVAARRPRPHRRERPSRPGPHRSTAGRTRSSASISTRCTRLGYVCGSTSARSRASSSRAPARRRSRSAPSSTRSTCSRTPTPRAS